MEWCIAAIVFAVLAKKGLQARGKQVDIKEAAASVASGIVLEVAELCEVEIRDVKNSKKS
jgi:hypothetical protein